MQQFYAKEMKEVLTLVISWDCEFENETQDFYIIFYHKMWKLPGMIRTTGHGFY